MGSENKFTSAQYSALVLGILSGKEAESQAVYFDINPDIYVEIPEELVFVDLDFNGVDDFLFWNTSYMHYYTYYEQNSRFKQRLFAGPWGTFVNGIVGRYQYYTVGFGLSIAFMLDEGEMINNDRTFNQWGPQSMAIRTYDTVEIYSELFYLTGEGGYWFPPVEDKYLGIKFKAEDEKMHFGWIRCSVIDEHEEGLTLIIKDYAYESKPNVPIIAGDTIGDTTKFVLEAEEIHELDANIYSFQKTIYCIINHEDMNAELFIYSISGEKIVTQKLTAEKTAIDFSKYAAGIYVVEIRNDDKKFVKKVLVE